MANEDTKFRDFLDSKVLGRLIGLPLDARHAMVGSVSGRHRSPVRGSSLEFAEYREYVPGDDTRRLDWRTWGRTDRYYIKEFEADTNLRLCLIIDTSGSMAYGEKGNSRLEYCRKLAGTLAYLAAHQGDAIGVFPAGKNGLHHEIPARRGPVHLGVVMDRISALEARGETDLVGSIHEAAEKIPQRALVVIISDLLFRPDPLQEALQHLRYRKHDVALFHLLDRSEVDFEFDRPTRFVDLEGSTHLLADPTLIGAKYREAVSDYLDDVAAICSQTGIDYHLITTDQPYDQALARFLLGRNPRTKRVARNVG